jgi:hypothetical protein
MTNNGNNGKNHTDRLLIMHDLSFQNAKIEWLDRNTIELTPVGLDAEIWRREGAASDVLLDVNQLRADACELVCKAVVNQGGPRLARIFELWQTIEVLKNAGDAAGYTEQGRSVLISSAEKLKALLQPD